jgi:hypothetical protein
VLTGLALERFSTIAFHLAALNMKVAALDGVKRNGPPATGRPAALVKTIN